MSDFEDLFKAGAVLVMGAVILSAAGSLAITPELLSTFQKLGMSLIVFSIIVGVAIRIFDALR